MAGEAWAVAKTYTGAPSGNWSVSGNWTPPGVPGTADDVTVNTNASNVDISFTIQKLTVNGLGAVTVNGTLTLTGLSGVSVDWPGAGGSIVNNGTIVAQRDLQGTGSGTISGSGVLQFEGAAAKNWGGANITWGNIQVNGGNVTLQSATACTHLEMNGPNVDLNSFNLTVGASGLVFNSGSTLSVRGGQLTVTGVSTFTGGASQQIDGATGGGATTVIALLGGLGGPFGGGRIDIPPGGTLRLGATSNLNNIGSVTAPTTWTLVLTGSGGTFTPKVGINYEIVTFTGFGTTDLAGSIVAEQGLIVNGSGTLSLAGGVSLNVTADAKLQLGTLLLGNGASTSISGDLVFQGGTLQGPAAGSATVTVQGSVPAGSGSVVMNTSTLNLQGALADFSGLSSFTSSGSTVLNGPATARTLRAGTAVQFGSLSNATSVPVTSEGVLKVSSLTVRGNWTLAASATISGALTLNAGTFSVGGVSMTVGGATTVNGGTITASAGGSLTLNGDLLTTGGAMFLGGAALNLNGATSSFSGLSAFSITGPTAIGGGAASRILAVKAGINFAALSNNPSTPVVIDGGLSAGTASVFNQWILNSSATFGGAVTIHTGGTFRSQSANGTLSFGSNVTVASGGALRILPPSPGPTMAIFAEGSTVRVAGTFEVAGYPGSEVVLRDGDALPDSIRWLIVDTGTVGITYAAVQDSDASGGNTILASNSTDNGGNVNWSFIRAPYNCQSQASGSFQDAATWTNCGGTAPMAADNVTIITGHTVTMSSSVSVANAVLPSGATLSGNSGVNLSVTAQIDGAAGSTLSLSGTGNLSTGAGATVGTFNLGSGAISGNVILLGTFTCTGACTSTGSFTLNHGSSIAAGGSATFANLAIANAATASASGTISINNLLVINSAASFTSSGTVTLNNGALINNSGSLVFNAVTIAPGATVTTSSSFTVNGSLTVSGGATFTPSGTTTLGNSSSIANNGTLTLGNLAVTNGAAAGSSSSFAITGSLFVPGASTFVADGTITFPGSSPSIGGNGQLRFAGLTIGNGGVTNAAISSNVSIGALTVSASATLNATVGTIVTIGNSIANSGALQLDGLNIVSPSTVTTSGTLIADNVTVPSGATLNLNGNTTAGTLAVEGFLNLGPVILMLTSTGTPLQIVGGGTFVAASGSTVAYSGAGGFGTTVASVTYANVTFSGLQTYRPQGTFAANGSVIVNSGATFAIDNPTTVTFGSTVTVNGGSTLTIGATGGNVTALFAEGATLFVAGTLQVNGGSDYVFLRDADASPDGARWMIVNAGTVGVTRAVVQDSDASGGNTIFATNSVDNGSNLNWWFGSSPGFTILTTSPDASARAASRMANVEATTNDTVNVSTVMQSTFRVQGDQTGRIAGVYSASGAMFSLDPTNPFKPGELIRASATNGIQNATGVPLQPRVWQFTAGAAAGTAFLGSHTSFSSAGESVGLALGDLDGDGDLDAVLAHYGTAETVWLNNGGGTFTLGQSFGSNQSTDVALGDLDGDGDLDAVIANEDGASTSWLNDGGAAFTLRGSFGASGGTGISLGDLDRDGDLDAVIANYLGAESVWMNDGTGTFTAHPTAPTFGSGSSQHVALGDLDRDGDLDAIVANDGQNETVWINDGGGAFAAHPSAPNFDGGTNSTDVVLGDLDGDGDLDEVVANSGTQAETVWLNNGSGAFSAHASFGAGASRDVALADLDGDGDLDVIVGNANDEAETVWLNDGAANFSPHPLNPSFGNGSTRAIGAGDIDGDGDLDAVVVNANAAETVWLNRAAAGVTVTPVSGLTTTEAGGTATFTIVLASQPQADLSIQISSSDTTEGRVSSDGATQQDSANVTFTNSDWSTPKLITVHGRDDSVDDGDVAYNIITGASTSTDPLYSGVNASDVSVTNGDNDAAGVTVTPTTVSVAESGTSAAFTLVLSSEPTGNVVIDIAASDTTEATASPAQRTFTPESWSATQTVTVTGVDDSLDDGDQQSSVVVSINTAATDDSVYHAINPTDVTVTTTDDDKSPTTTTLSSSANPSLAGQLVTFTATVTSSTAGTITGAVTFKNGPTTLGTSTLSGGSASLSTSSLPPGTHPITGEYGADANYAASVSSILSQVVNAAPFGAPPAFSATANSTSQVTLSWGAVSGATNYEIYRSSLNAAYNLIAVVSTTIHTDNALTANTTYLYRVRANGSGGASAFSSIDPATTTIFTDATLNGLVVIKAVHLTQLRTAVNAMRAAAGLPAFSFTDSSAMAGVTIVKRVHIAELRTALDEARSTIRLPALSYTDPTLVSGLTPVKGAHFAELRAGTQ